MTSANPHARAIFTLPATIGLDVPWACLRAALFTAVAIAKPPEQFVDLFVILLSDSLRCRRATVRLVLGGLGSFRRDGKG